MIFKLKFAVMKSLFSPCRNGHIDNLKKLGEKYKKKDWGWLWVEAMAQPKLEEAVRALLKPFLTYS